MSLQEPMPEQTLTDYLSNFTNDDDRAAATMLFRTKSFGMGVKILNEENGVLGGYGIPFGGPVHDKNHVAGKDLDGEYFHEKTNFCFDWFPQDNRPVLYDHGTDPEVKLAVVGRQTSKFTDPKLGVWVEVQLDMANAYSKYLLELAKKGVLGYSSGALGGYVRRDKNGAIDQWPWIEQTLTVRPANPYALIAADAVKHLEMAGVLPPELAGTAPADAPPTLTDALKAELGTPNKRLTLPDGMSINDLRDALESAIKGLPGVDVGDYCYVTDVKDGYAVASLEDGYVRYPFTMASDGTVKITGVGEAVERQEKWVTTEGKVADLQAVAEHLKGHGWSQDNEASRKLSARNMGQLHEAIKTQGDLHRSVCDMGTDCPLYDASTASKAQAPVDPATEASRQEIDEYLATIELRRGSR